MLGAITEYSTWLSLGVMGPFSPRLCLQTMISGWRHSFPLHPQESSLRFPMHWRLGVLRCFLNTVAEKDCLSPPGFELRPTHTLVTELWQLPSASCVIYMNYINFSGSLDLV